MKKAHKYKMKVLFENGKKWDLDILAVDITWLFCWIRSEQNIINLEINLIKKDVEDVKDCFGALDITKNEI